MKSMTFRKRAGQNTVEYLLILAVIVGVVLIAGTALKNYMPSLFSKVAHGIDLGADQLSRGAGNNN